MGTDIRQSRMAIARRNLGTAALASAVALLLFGPVTPGTRSGTASQSARTSASATVSGAIVRVPIPVSARKSNRETGCCA